MSAILIFQKENELYFGTDSAVSTIINGELFRLTEDGQKIWIVEDKLIFCSGNMDMVYDLINKYVSTSDKSIKLLQELAMKVHDDSSMFEIMVGCIQNNKTIVYQISSYNDFEIIERCVSGNEIGLWTGGIKTNECFDIACKGLEQKNNILDIYQDTFNNISYEGIGGELSIYKIDINNICLVYKNFIVEKGIRRFYIGDKYLIVGERVYGRILAGEHLILDCSTPEGLKTMVVNYSGVRISGMTLTIEGDLDNPNSNGIELSPQPQEGLTITKSDKYKRIRLNANDGIKITGNSGSTTSPVWDIDEFYIDTEGNLTLDGQLKLTDSGKLLMKVFKDTEGGVIQVFDKNGKLNAKLGVEAGTANNTGGTLVLYKDVPITNLDDPSAYQRVEAGIIDDHGIVNVCDENAKIRAMLEANGSVGPRIVIFGTDGLPLTYLTSTEGAVNNQIIATQNWVNDKIQDAIAAHVATYHSGL